MISYKNCHSDKNVRVAVLVFFLCRGQINTTHWHVSVRAPVSRIVRCATLPETLSQHYSSIKHTDTSIFPDSTHIIQYNRAGYPRSHFPAVDFEDIFWTAASRYLIACTKSLLSQSPYSPANLNLYHKELMHDLSLELVDTIYFFAMLCLH